jgi:hypothetical protein
MAGKEANKPDGTGRAVDTLISIVVLGSLWGLSEVVLGSILKTAGVAWRVALLTGLGLGIVGIGAAVLTRRSFATLAAVPVVAVACKQLVVPILGVSPMCKANSCLAVMLEGVAMAGAVSIAGRRLENSGLARVAAGGSAAAVASIAFFVGGMQLAPCNYLLSFNHPGGLLAFVAAEGLVWAAFSALLFPIGYLAGARVRSVLPQLRARRRMLYYGTSAALVAVSWVGSSLAIAAGA